MAIFSINKGKARLSTREAIDISIMESINDLDERIARFETGAAYEQEEAPNRNHAKSLAKAKSIACDALHEWASIVGDAESCAPPDTKEGFYIMQKALIRISRMED